MEIVRDYEQTAWNVLVDQSQITQILLNLAVNARDAMEGKGTLTIRARNVTVDTNYVHKHSYARTGEDELTRACIGVFVDIIRVDGHIPGTYRQRPLALHGIPCVHCQVEQDLC